MKLHHLQQFINAQRQELVVAQTVLQETSQKNLLADFSQAAQTLLYDQFFLTLRKRMDPRLDKLSASVEEVRKTVFGGDARTTPIIPGTESVRLVGEP